ncbi:diphthine--ammonia ligase [Paracnuella aquatica]|nr:diphthine--ammonia ligase [Paracnuella aquatica]
MNWSGGKDSALALHHAQQNGVDVAALFTSINAAHQRITMHGVRRALLELQAAALGLPLVTAELPLLPAMEDYNNIMSRHVAELKAQGFDTAIFGDIFLEDLKQYRERELGQQGMNCYFPLWQKDSAQLMEAFIAAGFKAIVVCVNGSLLDESFCGRLLDTSFVADLPADVDPCGERGEYHSFVFDGPIFKTPVPFAKGGITTRHYPMPKSGNDCFRDKPAPDMPFYFCDLEPVAEAVAI